MEFMADVVRGSGTIMLAFATAGYLKWEPLPPGFYLTYGLACWFAAAWIGVAIR